MEKDEREILIAKRVQLVEDIDIQGGLFTQLLSRKVLNRRTINKLKLNRTPEEQVEELLNELPKRECFEDFCEALIADDQEHIVNKYLKVPLPTASPAKKVEPVGQSSVTESEATLEVRQGNAATPGISDTSSATTAAQAAIKRAHSTLSHTGQSSSVICIREEDNNRHLYIRYADENGGGSGGTPEKRSRPLESLPGSGNTIPVSDSVVAPAVTYEPDETRYAMKHYVSQETGLPDDGKALMLHSAVSSGAHATRSLVVLNNPQSVLHNPNIVDRLRYSEAFVSAHNLKQTSSENSSLAVSPSQNAHHLLPHNFSPQGSMPTAAPSQNPITIHHNGNIINIQTPNSAVQEQHHYQQNHQSFINLHPGSLSSTASSPQLLKPSPHQPSVASPLKDSSRLINTQSSDVDTAHIQNLLHTHSGQAQFVQRASGISQFEDPQQYLQAAGVLSTSKDVNSLSTPANTNNSSQMLNRCDSVDKVNLTFPAKSVHLNPADYGLSMSSVTDCNDPLDGANVNKSIFTKGINAGGGDCDATYDLDQIDLPDGCVNVKVEHCTRQFFLANHKKSYLMRRIPRGLALIINVDEVEGKPPRKGTNFDRENLCNLLCQLHFNIIVYNDKDGLSAQEMVNKLKDFAKLPEHAEMDACFVCLLSHGEEGFIFGTDGKRIPLEEIFMLFGNTNCRGLIGKPKIFIIQACRGGYLDKGIRMDEVDGGSVPGVPPSNPNSSTGAGGVQLPSMSDMLVCYPTLTGYYAWRNRARGSWYIEAIVQVFMRYAKSEDVCAMLNRVNQLVSKKVSECNQKEMNAMSQMSEYKSSLRQPHLFLFPGIGICMNN